VIYLNKAETQACILPYTNQCHIKDTTRMLFYTACILFLTSGYKQKIKTSPDDDFIGNMRISNIFLHTVILHLWVIGIR